MPEDVRRIDDATVLTRESCNAAPLKLRSVPSKLPAERFSGSSGR